MSGPGCNFKKGVIANTDRIIGIDSAGLVDGEDHLQQGIGSYSLTNVNFTRYHHELMSNFTKVSVHGCSTWDVCLGVKTSFYWTGASKFPWSFVCRDGKKCKFLIVHDGQDWSSIQSDSPHRHALGDTRKVFDVRYSRLSHPPKLTFSFVSFGPSERQVLFNKVLAVLKIHLLREKSGGYIPLQVQRICRFSDHGIPEGTFGFNSNKTKV